jgi:hypothetical protein
MKSIFLLVVMSFFIFSCEKYNVNLQEVTSVESVTDEQEISGQESNLNKSICAALLISQRRLNSLDSCCRFAVSLDQNDNIHNLVIGYWVNGKRINKFLLDDPIELPIEICDGESQLVEIYINGQLCYSNLFECETVDTTCNSFLCWEDFAGSFDCAKSMIVEMPDGTVQELSFGGDIITVPGFDLIAEALVKNMEDLGYGGSFTSEGGECMKGDNDIPGFIFNNTEIRILQICGGGCDSGPAVTCVDFTNECS